MGPGNRVGMEVLQSVETPKLTSQLGIFTTLTPSSHSSSLAEFSFMWIAAAFGE